MKVDRAKGPVIHPIRQIQLPKYREVILKNGTPVYFVRDGSQELIKMDIVFEGARHHESYRTQAKAHAALLKDGTTTKSSDEISNLIDFYGASYSTKSSLDYTSVNLFCLTRHFEKLLPTIADILLNPVFPEDEIRKYINNSQHRLKLSLAKNEVIAYRELGSLIFGENHVYGYNSQISDFEQISQESLLDYHNQMLKHHPCSIFVAGEFDIDEVIQLLESSFSFLEQKNPYQIKYPSSENGGDVKNKTHFFKSKNKHQVALRMGKRFGNRLHPEYAKMAFLNNVFGGFFGSRLMRNIREDKGYTYNIFSDLDCMKKDGYFMIHTELDKIHLDNCLKEIYMEIDRLKQDLIPQEELEMNRNYILGNMLHGIDGPFNAMKLVKSVILNERKITDIETSFNTIVEMTSEELRDLAQRFLNKDELIEVIVGA